MKIGTIFIVFICLFLSTSCQKKVILELQQPINTQIHDTNTNKPARPKDKKQTEPISKLPFNVIVKYYKNYQEEISNGIILPIQIKDNQLEFVKDYNLNQLNLNSFSTQTIPNCSLQAIMDTNYPPEFPGDWIISNQQHFYYLNTKKTDQNYDFYLTCYDKKVNKIKWEARLCQYKPYIHSIKLLDYGSVILASTPTNFHVFCIDKQNGVIQWEKAIQPDILKELVKEPNNGCKDILLYPKYQFEQVVVYNFYSKCYNPDNKQADMIVDKTFYLSLDGVTSNVLNNEPIAFYQDAYFYIADNKYFCASLLDNHLIWEKELSGCPIFGKDPFLFCQNRRTLHIVDKKTGEMVDTETIPSVMNIKNVVKLDNTYYLIGERQYKPIGNDYGGIQNDVVDEHFLLIWSKDYPIQEIKIQQPLQAIMIDVRKIIGIYPLKKGVIIFFQSGFIVMNNLTCTFMKYPFPDGDEAMISFNEYPIIFVDKEKFVITFVPNDRGYVLGGKIMVLSVD